MREVDGRKSLLDIIVVVQKDYRNKLLDLNMSKIAGAGISEPHLVVVKVVWEGSKNGRDVRNKGK